MQESARVAYGKPQEPGVRTRFRLHNSPHQKSSALLLIYIILLYLIQGPLLLIIIIELKRDKKGFLSSSRGVEKEEGGVGRVKVKSGKREVESEL
jgi:hypothetical protein